MHRYLFLPAALATLVFNLIPLFGVLFWDWDTFQLLMLYWIETVIIAFWTIRRLARLPEEQDGGGTTTAKPVAFGLAGFFTLHAGIFIGVHFVFLWAFFSYEWLGRVRGVGSFFYELFAANGVWAALVLMLIVHSVAYLTEPAARRVTGDRVLPIVAGLYIRIIVMQIAILAGAWISGFSGSMGPLVIVIVLKTLLDLGLGAYTPLKVLTATTASTAAER